MATCALASDPDIVPWAIFLVAGVNRTMAGVGTARTNGIGVVADNAARLSIVMVQPFQG
jgi:hypothetical protein